MKILTRYIKQIFTNFPSLREGLGMGFFLFLFLFSCKPKEVKIPVGILPKEQIVNILTDVHLAEAALTYKSAKSDSAMQLAVDYYNYIYQSRHVTKKQFDESLDFYTKHPELLEKIYEEVINELSKKQAEAVNY